MASGVFSVALHVVILLLTNSVDQLQKMINDLNTESKAVGLKNVKINLLKTKVILNQYSPQSTYSQCVLPVMTFRCLT